MHLNSSAGYSQLFGLLGLRETESVEKYRYIQEHNREAKSCSGARGITDPVGDDGRVVL